MDHPHACGDKFFLDSCRELCIGSSPRVWGQEEYSCTVDSHARIIPTRVGTSSFYVDVPIKCQDHPHACGDKYLTHIGRPPKLGSSPRVWGQDRSFLVLCTKVWIIPTRVGTRRIQKCAQKSLEDHPHACGDKFVGANMPPHKLGSSPRVWGQGTFNDQCRHAYRIIPTRVGTSPCRSLPYGGLRDHPHACGDKLPPFRISPSRLGSSPRVWGQVDLNHTEYRVSGIIPTRVGTSNSLSYTVKGL